MTRTSLSEVSDEFDVCIVGSGPGGAILATELARDGLQCLIVEGGSGQRPDVPYEEDEYPLETTRFLGLGGTSNLWGGSCSRFHPRDFERGSWPIAYSDLEPYYWRAENELQVAGEESEHSPLRNRPYPYPVPGDYESSVTAEVFTDGGVEVQYPPMAGAFAMVQSHLPSLRSSPTVTLLEETWVRRIVTGKAGRVEALEATNLRGESSELRAKEYVLATGGVETPRLLLLSRSPQFPNGLGNHSGMVGRYFMEHLWAPLGHATVQARGFTPSDTTMEALSWEYYERLEEKGLAAFHLECFADRPREAWSLDWRRPVESARRWLEGDPLTVRLNGLWEMEPRRENRVVLDESSLDSFGDPRARVEVSLSDVDRQSHGELLDVARDVFARLGARGATVEMVPPSWCHHHMGTCRMGTDLRSSVVDPDLRVHGTENLHVVGSSTFCSGGAGPPTLLLVALALRLSDRLSSRRA